MTCTFFGHRNTYRDIQPTLASTIIDLIETKQVDTFYYGNHGNFDRMVHTELKKLKAQYPHIRCFMVLAYLPSKDEHPEAETIFPEGIEAVPKKFAISFRNQWMLDQSEFVISYTTSSIGGAAKFTDKAIKRGRTVIQLAQL